MTRPTQSAFAPALARTPEELTATNVVSGWIESVSTLAAPALTGVVLALRSPAWVFGLVAACCLLGAVLVMSLRTVGFRAATEPGDEESERVSGSIAFVRA